jgi:hypothetical protein
MAILADTDVLLRTLYPGHPHHYAVENALTVLRPRGEVLSVAPPNPIECKGGE